MKIWITAFVATAFMALPAAADETQKSTASIPEPVRFETSHKGSFGGQKLSYKAIAGETYLRDGEGKPTGSFFSTAYIKDGVKDKSTRPVTFIFNGGPGSASMWLHMGVFGPKRVVVPSEPDDDGAPPYPVVDNSDTLLDLTDMVFIDPVGTGYSRALPGTESKTFWGLNEDATSVADFIQTWITENGRWNSPKFIAGESYGTVRSAVVADMLSSRNISLNGIALISAVLDYQNSRFQHGSIMSYVSFLPTYAATAWYHDALANKPENLEAFLQEVRDFARTEYATALIAGHRLSDAERQRIIKKLAAYTGLSEGYLDKANMRVHVFRFFKELMRESKTVVGRIDSRYTGVEVDAVGEFMEADPFGYQVGSAFTTAINDHLAGFLNVKMDRPYMTSAKGAFPEWNWVDGKKAPNGGRYINLIPHLGRAMRRNKDLKVLVPSGYFDFATPFFGAENAIAEEGIPHDRVTFSYYEAGHMMYLHDASRAKFLNDMRVFLKDALQ